MHWADRNTRHWGGWLTALGLCVTASPAWAGPPFITNDPDPPEVGQFEINLPFTLERAPDGGRAGQFVTFDINYGADRFTQLSVEVPVAYSQPAGGGTWAGVGDVLLEYKRRFGTDPRRGYFGINPQLLLPTGSERRGLGPGRMTAQFPLLYQKQWGKTVFYTDLRYRLRGGEEGRSFWFLGGVVERQVGSRLKVGGELYGTTPKEAGGKHNAGFNLGFRYTVSPGHVLMVSGGRSFRGDPDLTLFVGWRLLTPPSR
jgi:hypothetical protein